MNFYMIGPLCQASQIVFASTDLQGSRNASIKQALLLICDPSSSDLVAPPKLPPGPSVDAYAAGLRVKVPTMVVFSAYPTFAPLNRHIFG